MAETGKPKIEKFIFKINFMRGYFGIGIYQPKTETNLGTLWRSAHNFGASFIFTIGDRYKKMGSDTTKSFKHVPLYSYEEFEDFKKHIPFECPVIFIEQTKNSKDIKNFIHPEKCIYLLGAEDNGIPEDLMRGHQVVHISTPMCLNVAVAGSIIMFDRVNKLDN